MRLVRSMSGTFLSAPKGSCKKCERQGSAQPCACFVDLLHQSPDVAARLTFCKHQQSYRRCIARCLARHPEISLPLLLPSHSNHRPLHMTMIELSLLSSSDTVLTPNGKPCHNLLVEGPDAPCSFAFS